MFDNVLYFLKIFSMLWIDNGFPYLLIKILLHFGDDVFLIVNQFFKDDNTYLFNINNCLSFLPFPWIMIVFSCNEISFRVISEASWILMPVDINISNNDMFLIVSNFL